MQINPILRQLKYPQPLHLRQIARQLQPAINLQHPLVTMFREKHLPLRTHGKPGLQDAAIYRPPQLMHHNALGSHETCMLLSLLSMKDFLDTAMEFQGDSVVTDHFFLLYHLSSNQDDLCPFYAHPGFFSSVPTVTFFLCPELSVLHQLLCHSCPHVLPLFSVSCYCNTLCPAFS